MSNSIDSNSIDKSSLDDENNGQTSSEGFENSQDKLDKKLENRLKEIENNLDIKLIRLYDKNFDGDSYREALKSQVIATVSEPINKKYNLWFTIGTLIFGLGGTIVVTNMISAQVAAQFKEKLPDMVSAGEENLSDQLMLLLEIRQLNENAKWVDTRIEKRKEFTKVLKGFILNKSSTPQQREYAINYAGDARDTVQQELIDPILKIFHDRDQDPGENYSSASPIERGLALRAILKYRDQKRYLDGIIKEISDSSSKNQGDFREEIVKILALANIESDRPELGNLMVKNLEEKSAKPDQIQAASLFFLLHPKQWEQVKSKLGDLKRSEKDGKQTNQLPPYKVILNELVEIKTSKPFPLKPGLKTEYMGEIEKIFKISSDAIQESEKKYASHTQIIKGKLYKEISLIALQRGEKQLFNEVMKVGYYDHAVWCERVLPLFSNSFNTDESDLCSNDEATKEGQQKIQDNLSANTSNFKWDPASLKYRSEEELSIVELRTGKHDSFIKFMEQSYYRSATWEKEVLPLFPDALKPAQKVFSSPSPLGNKVNQDALWKWVERYKGKLVWNQADSKWNLKP